ncbi:CDP-diacylglycerol--serine O-phosphatidyltransferase [Pectinatus cerevisiiphilus]|uniref:CDP-diacylglycerol--serine O-phosphatidyltransferase n=2 Tax=Pectinatus cerevisiiphilus TaxID=86956 RepID=A0A4R3K743_9FIRM|nr:CDP-alcohol phosphatidyltransferase family protein [Pectinatus cerevisiiphilus]TCS78754.1 CDP-diacylglycerol--serine O-phosphatidyltransferase [Pectinatus cerevisiiphilus]
MSKAWIPNLCTSMNLVFGILAIFVMLMGGVKFGPLIDAPICILLALIADGLDGRLARRFGTVNERGKEMDSLCDVVSFGVAPGIISVLFTLSIISMAAMKAGTPPDRLKYFMYFSIVAGVIYAVCGMWRLARFNVNASIVHGHFMGLPIPAGGCMIATAAMLIANLPFIPPIAIGYAIPIIVIITGLLMISSIHYPDFKGTGEKINIIALIISLLFALAIIFLCRAVFPFAVLFAIFSTYAVFGILNTICNKIA